jgi:hypothetical protein
MAEQRQSEPLHVRIGKLRDAARAETATTAQPAREQVDVMDGAIRVSAHMAGKQGAERRAALRDVQPGATITADGASKTRLTREQKLDKTKAWAEGLTPEARAEYSAGEKFARLSYSAQEKIEEAFDAIDGAVSFDLDEDAQVDWNIGQLDQQEEDEATDAWLEGLDDSSGFDDTYNEEDE